VREYMDTLYAHDVAFAGDGTRHGAVTGRA
jgi:hypothetical protein